MYPHPSFNIVLCSTLPFLFLAYVMMMMMMMRRMSKDDV